MHEVFPAHGNGADVERAYAEVIFSMLPVGRYLARMVVSRNVASPSGQNEEVAGRVPVWSDSVIFSVEALETSARNARPTDDAGVRDGPEAHQGDDDDGKSHQDDSSGIFFDFPPNMHHFENGQSPHVTFRIDRGFEPGDAAHIYLNDQFVAASSTPKGSVNMDNIPFDHGHVYNVTVSVSVSGMGAHGSPSRSRSVFFTSDDRHPQDILVCMYDPVNCVSRHDLALPPPQQPWSASAPEELHGPSNAFRERGEPPPVEIGWKRLVALHELPRMHAGQLSKHASSNAPLHSMPDFSNFLRAEDGELVLMDDFGPGCVFRIFMPVVMGPDDSGPRWRFRVRVDGELKIDELMGVLAELGTAPFIHPVAGFGNLKMGFYSMVPIVFHKRIVVSMVPAPPLVAQQVLDDSIYCLTQETLCSCKVYWDIDYTLLADTPADAAFEMVTSQGLLDALAMMEFSSFGKGQGSARQEEDRCAADLTPVPSC